MEEQISEKPIEKEEPLQAPSGTHTDELFDAIGKMTTADLQKPDAGLKLLTAQYKEKCIENRQLQDKVAGLSIKKEILSNKLSVALERLRQIGSIHIAMNIFSLLAGALIIVATLVDNPYIQKGLYAIGIIMFMICIIYYITKKNLHTNIGDI